MRLINQTKNIILAEDVFIANTFFKRIRGLLGKKGLLPNQAMLLEPCNSVHTFFMGFTIDILFVNKGLKVLKVLPGLAPNKLSRIYWYSRMAIELPAGTLVSTHTQTEDQLKLLD
jgi:uncharacterized protein